jgi:TolB-like protein
MRPHLATCAPLLIAALGLTTSGLQAQGGEKRPTIAVIQFNNSSLVNAADYAVLSKGMADLLGSTLRGNPAVSVVDRDAIQEVLREQNLAKEGRIDEATAAQVGRIIGAQYLIKGTFFIEPKGRVRITAQAVNSTTGEIAYSETANGTRDDILAVIDQLGERLNHGLKLGDLKLPERGSDGSGPTRWAALMKYSRALEADDQGDAPSAVALYKEFLTASSTAVFAVDQKNHAEKRVRLLSGGS